MRNSCKAVLYNFLAACMALLAGAAAAQTNFWQQTNGPYGGDVRALAINARDDIFAGTYGYGIFRSIPSGRDENWMPVNTGLTINTVLSLAINKSTGHIFAGTGFFFGKWKNGAIFRSADNGETWKKVKDLIAGGDTTAVFSLAINARGDIFAGTESRGIFRSTDNGDTWKKVNNGLTNISVFSLAINDSGHVFVGTLSVFGPPTDGGVYRSINNGDNWTHVKNGLINTTVFALAIDDSAHIFAGTGNAFSGKGGAIFRSINNGQNWTRVKELPNNIVTSFGSNSAGHIFAGSNGGGVFRSTDGGGSWPQVNTGLANTNVRTLAINSAGQIFAGTPSGVFRSMDNGDTWQEINQNLIAFNVSALVIKKNGHIFAGTNVFLSPVRGVLRSTDRGNTWTEVNNGLANRFVSSLALNSNEHIFAGTFGGVFRSMDNGDSWTALTTTGLTDRFILSLVVNASGDIFAGTNGNGIFRLLSGSASWDSVNIGLTNRVVRSFAINSSNGYIFAGTAAGVFRSTNNGDAWTTGLTDQNVYALAINANGDIFAGTRKLSGFSESGGAIFRSTDHGGSWTKVHEVSNKGFLSLAINKINGAIFAGTAGNGVFYSLDKGDQWTEANSGLTTLVISSFAVDSTEHIYAGTDGGGVFRSAQPAKFPLAITNAATTVGVTSATLNGAVNPNGLDTMVKFLYGTTTSYGNEVAAPSRVSGANAVMVNATLSVLSPNTLYHFRVVATNSAGTTNGADKTFMTLANQAPNISHTPIPLAPSGQQIIVQANITDDTGQVSALLNFRQGGESRFTTIAMSANGALFQGIIPESVVTSRGVEYFIVAADQYGLTTRLPASSIFSVQVRKDNEAKLEAQPSGSVQTAYRLISAPLDLDDKSPAAVLEDDLGKYDDTKWRFSELVADRSYVEFPGISTMPPGKAFWLLVKDAGKVIDTGAGKSNSTAKEFKIALHPGWNLVGNPFNFSIPVKNIRLQSGRTVELRSYTGSWNDPVSTKVTTMQRFDGYALCNNSTSVDMLFVNPDLSSSSSEVSSSTFRHTPLANLQSLKGQLQTLWSIRILAQCQEARDVDNTAAIIAGVSRNYDERDQPEPPVIGEYVSVYFPHRDWEPPTPNYCADARPEFSQGEIWDFEVTTNIRDKVNLTFEGLEQVPEEFEIWLVDKALNISQNLREKSSCSVAGSNHPKRLQLVVGRQDFIAEKLSEVKLIPTNYELSQNFPNPFNPATTIRYGLPKAERVTLRVYSLLGEEVATLINDELKDAGYHAAIWDGRNRDGRQVASGVYVYRLRTGSFVMTKKMALVQ